VEPSQGTIVGRRLLQLSRLLKTTPYADLLTEAITHVEGGDYRKALQFVQSARDGCSRLPSPVAAGGIGAALSAEQLSARFNEVALPLEALAAGQASENENPLHSDEPPAAHRGNEPVVLGVEPGAFTLLLTAAQQCGLVPNADAIVGVRDRDYPAGRYQRALDTIEALAVQLNTQAARRAAELRHEEIRYKAGALKMSPKQWMLKIRRDAEQTQRIDRARRHFAHVLDSLRALRAASSD
jgi:hypothetical protein